MKMYSGDIGILFLRFYFFTGLIVLAGFTGYLYVGVVIGMILFLASIAGVQFKKRLVHPRKLTIFDHHHLPLHRYNMWHQRHHWAAH